MTSKISAPTPQSSSSTTTVQTVATVTSTTPATNESLTKIDVRAATQVKIVQYSTEKGKTMAHAWELLNKDESWRNPSDKHSLLNEELGITSCEHLVYLEPSDMQVIMDKLKTIPARMLAATIIQTP